MYAQVDKSKENKSREVGNSVVQHKSNVKQGFGFVDNRPETVAQRKLHEMVSKSPHISRLRVIQGIANEHATQKQSSFQKKENNAGLQDNLKSSIQGRQDSVLQMKQLPRFSIATDLAHHPQVRAALFTSGTLEAYPGPRMLNAGGMESQDSYRASLMTQELENDPRISYKPMGAKFFSSNKALKIVSHLKKVAGETETMFLQKKDLIGIANKNGDTDVHPRILGGLPDVDMAGTVVVNNLGDIPVGGRDINVMTLKEKRKALMGWQGEITFTNNSGHFQFDSLPEEVKEKLTEMVKGGRELTEDVLVKFSAR